jgi:hypothetical protein
MSAGGTTADAETAALAPNRQARQTTAHTEPHEKSRLFISILPAE